MRQINTPLSLGGRIEDFRKSKRLTQDDLAQLAECSRRTIINLEKGGNVATHTLLRVLASLGLTMTITEKRTDFHALRELQENAE